MSINSTDHSDCPRKKGFSRRGAGGEKMMKNGEEKEKKERKEESTNLCWTSPFLSSVSHDRFFSPLFLLLFLPPFPLFARYAGHTGLWLATFGGEKTLNTRDIFPWWSIRDRKLAAIDAGSRKENRKITPVISSRGKSWGNRGVGSFF